MTKYIANCSDIIDWDYIRNNIDDMKFLKRWCPKNIDEWKWKAENEYFGSHQDEVRNLINKMENAKINFDFIQICEYWLEDNDPLIYKFSNFLNVKPILAYISVIHPGHGIFSHWDIDTSEPDHLSMGNVRRFSCFIEPPTMGHFFIVNDVHMYNQEKGAVWEWDNYRSEHIGVNFGLKTKYLFNFLGYS